MPVILGTNMQWKTTIWTVRPNSNINLDRKLTIYFTLLKRNRKRSNLQHRFLIASLNALQEHFRDNFQI